MEPIKRDVEDIGSYLRVTMSLVSVLTRNYLGFNDEVVSNRDTLDILSKNGFHNGKTGSAYEVIRCYGIIADIAVIIEDRLETVYDMLDNAIS